ncbi:AsmA family protein [Shinella pollutisoli]|uniref:AsmA-like C-terminal region-containing protein n=1 Tax=Shinella pollutisoli TaxID=2250594 RepID=A0ABV7DDU6_9HYPH|nr:AsmA-like C-terminal region-containing protein [Shinella pollutisoli]
MNLFRFIRPGQLAGGLLAVVCVALAVRAAMPFLVRTDMVGKAIEESLEAWIGADVVIGEAPDFAFWPYPRVTLDAVRIIADTGEELARIETISAGFDLLGAVRGRPAFGDFELMRPVLHVGWNADGTLNWRRGGWLSEAIDTVAATPDGATPALGHERFGSAKVVDGIVTIARGADGEAYRISDINGSVNWPLIGKRLDLDLTGVAGGEVARWTFACDRPLALLAGRNAPVRAKLSSDPATVDFDGLANLSGNAFVSGRLHLSTPSLDRLLFWQGKHIPAADAVGQVDAEANVTTAGYSAKLEDLRLGLENAQATGVLDIAMPPDGKPQVGGTLAFDRIDLKAFLSAFTPLPDAGEAGAGIDTAFMRQFGLDLRLSAKSADFAPFSLRDLAAGIRIENGRASFDVGDSTFMDGTMSGRIMLTEEGFRGGGQLRMSLANVDIGGIVETLALPGPLPVGRGSAEFELSTDRPLWATTASDLSGQFRLRMGAGTLTHFDAQAFEALVEKNAFFNISQASGGSFDFTRAEVDARLDKGLAELTKAEIEGGGRTLSVSGMIPYRTGSVALAGTIAVTGQDGGTAPPPTGFFAGGSWPEPVISPLSVLTGRGGN